MNCIRFKINCVEYTVGCDVDSNTTLLDYLRDHLELRGTKYMCREAGCGACIVAAVTCPGGATLSVNACMVSITSCQDWEITTIERLGNKKKGYHILQKTLAEYNGTQCGYCTPAWIMNMYSLLKNGTKPTMLEIEKSFGSNVCRCTGYRPILDAFKTFAIDAPENNGIMDIEDLTICKKTGAACSNTHCDDDGWCILNVDDDDNVIKINLKDDKIWFKVGNLTSIFNILEKVGYKSYMLVFGNTAKGAYPILEYPDVLIDISSVAELKVVNLDQNLVIGAGLTLTELLDTLKNMAKRDNFEYFKILYDHIQLVAHISVRNIGSIGGNLMIKHQHNDFHSDIYLLFETVDAYLTIASSGAQTKRVSMQEFLTEDMRGKVISNVLLPPLSDAYKIYTYKVMPRFQNAHAIVNAGFLYKLSSSNRVLEARIVYGGLSPSFNRAANTERFLIGKLLFTNETVQKALTILQGEVVVTEDPPEPSVEYRKHLALALFYKGLLSLCPKDIVNWRYMSERSKIRETRPVSRAVQDIESDPALWPLNQPIPKIEALIQCAGESKYSDDIPTQPYEVHAAFAMTTVAVGDIVSIDANKALQYPGVIAFYTAKDIPGLNSFVPVYPFLILGGEEILCSGNVAHYNQPFGVIVAETRHIAEVAAKMIEVKYKNIKVPIIDTKEALSVPSRVVPSTTALATDRGTDVTKTIKGENTIYGQYHFTIENIVCVTRPTEEGLEVFPSSQWMDGTQEMIAKALNIQANQVDVKVRRVGGAFGIKITRSIRVAVACSLVTAKLNRPCRLVVPLTTTTKVMGKRLPCHTDFVCEVNSSGVIQYIDYNMYQDNGYKKTEDFSIQIKDGSYSNCYNKARWNLKLFDVFTDMAKNTWCRAPGTLEGIAMAEYIIERISYELSLDPFDVRIANLDPTHDGDLQEMAETLKTSASYDKRKASVKEFNRNNRWRKRGLRCSFVQWFDSYGAVILDVNLSVLHSDGTVIITHGGIEMGQGINTKAIQIAAYYLKIPISYIQVKANTTTVAPNCFITGGSLGSQSVAIGIRKCCEDLLKRLDPIKSQMTNPTWTEIINLAFLSDVDLQVHSYVGLSDAALYNTYGVALAETEVDVLTGEFQVRRVDVIQDVGQSVSPKIDLGQVEGAFIMGQGYWTCEDLVYDKRTGELLSDRTWNYYVPLATDIPQDFRVSFRKKSYSVPSILGAKVTGEPPICLSVVVALALRAAIAAAREESGIPITNWFQIGTLEGIAMAEYIIERISYELSLDPFDVRIANLDPTHDGDLQEMAETLKTSASYDKRKASVKEFNRNNRWRKRGLRCSFVQWFDSYGAVILDVNLSVLHSDGTVIITHGGIEMGQVTGEPPICLSVVVALALRAAIAAAREESGIPITNWFQIDGPYTVEKIALSSATNLHDFKFN